MEAAFISFLINKLNGVEFDHAQSRCVPLEQIQESVKGITDEFKAMQDFLEGSNWSTAAANELLEVWIGQVREVAVKIEDIIDEYLYLVGRKRESSITWKNCLMAPSDLCWNLPIAWRGIDSGLQKMQRNLSELSFRKVRYGLTVSGKQYRVNNSERDAHYYRVYDPMLIKEDDVVGIEENKSKLLSWLTNADTCRKMTAIAVCGMGGLGKTTLVANVYRNNTVKSHFDCQVWVTVSQTYSVEELLRKMIQEIFKEKMEHINYMSRLELFDILNESLRQKRYIVVLDDVWDRNMWSQMHHAFIDSDNGSRLVVTTRDIEAARIANDEHIIKLQQLNEEDAWILFCKKAFRTENNNVCPQVLENYGRVILNKCGGSPLAISVIGSLLSFKEKSESGWQGVFDRLQEFENNSLLDTLPCMLNLSFDDLPYHLKQCFLYCSIFPEDYLITRNKLIRLWVAEGFVEAKNSNRVLEEEAEDYLTELVDRSMLQVVKTNEFGRLKAFRMHDIVRMVSLLMSRKVKFCMILDGSLSGLDNQTRRLSIQTNHFLDLNMNLSRLHSLVVFSICNLSSEFLKAVLISFKMLRVLKLEGTLICNLPNEVSALFILHYLGLRETGVEQLPNNIQKLQSLQTLDLHGSKIKKIPHGVTQLKQLRHLIVSAGEVEFKGTVVGCFPTVERAWQWKNLQTLRSVKANEKLVQRLGDMKELRSLYVVEVEQAHCPQLCSSLSKMSNLRSLSLCASEEEQLNFEMLNSRPPPLQKIYFSGRLFEGKMPRFICSCTELTRVELYLSQLIEDPLPSLGRLPKLLEFYLMGDAFVGHKLHFRTGWFLNLKILYLRGLKNLNDIVIEEGAMVNLRELFMAELDLKMVPHGIEFLIVLELLSLHGMSEELWEKLKKDHSTAWGPLIRHIPLAMLEGKTFIKS